MDITVRLFATLREGRAREQKLGLPEGATPADILETLGIAREDVAILLVNGRDGAMEASLSDGDTVSLFPPVGGG